MVSLSHFIQKLLSNVRAISRLVFFAIGSTIFILRYILIRFFKGEDLNKSVSLLQGWTRLLVKGLGLKIEIIGQIPTTPGLLVCNHRSYTDPFLVFGILKAVPVGKASVANWPIVGRAGKLAGTVFVERSSKASGKKARKAIVDRLENGLFVINYAEGTTHIAPQTIPFKPGLFKDASIAQFPVYPVALEYATAKDAWIGDDVFIRHFLECFGKKRTYARISFGPALKNADAEALLLQTKRWIDKELLILREGWY